MIFRRKLAKYFGSYRNEVSISKQVNFSVLKKKMHNYISYLRLVGIQSAWQLGIV